jgi:CDP-diacylglycerol--glycerol-3-phosphate 3-phosphatidyltransferase
VVPCRRQGGSQLLDLKGRSKVAPVLEPIANGLGKIGFTPAGITLIGLVITVAGAVLVAFGYLTGGAAVIAVGVFLDTLDGPLARATGTASLRGAFLDTMSDRVGEISIWVGLAVYLREEPGWLVLCLLALAFSLLTPYVRAKAESWGAEGRGGSMGRAERMILAVLGIFFAGFWEPILYGMLVIFVVLSALTVAQRVRRTWQQLPG